MLLLSPPLLWRRRKVKRAMTSNAIGAGEEDSVVSILAGLSLSPVVDAEEDLSNLLSNIALAAPVFALETENGSGNDPARVNIIFDTQPDHPRRCD